MVKNHAFYAAVFFVFQKAFYVGSKRDTHSLAVHDQNNRRIRNSRQIISTCQSSGSCHSIVKSHNAFHHCYFTISTVFCKKVSGNLLSCKKSVQISGFCTNYLGMEHGINIIRSAFKGDCLYPSVYQYLQQTTGEKCFSASAGSCCKQDPGYSFFHDSPPLLSSPTAFFCTLKKTTPVISAPGGSGR